MKIRLHCRCGIDKLVLIVNLVVQMIAGAGSGRTDIAYEITFADRTSVTNCPTVKVRIGRLVTVLMVKLDEVAVSPVPAGESHDTVCGGIDRRIARSSQVDTFMTMTFMSNRMYPGTERRGYPDIFGRSSVRHGDI